MLVEDGIQPLWTPIRPTFTRHLGTGTTEQAMRQQDDTRDEQAVAPGGQQNVAPRERRRSYTTQPVASVLKGSRWPKAEIKSVDIEEMSTQPGSGYRCSVSPRFRKRPPFWES